MRQYSSSCYEIQIACSHPGVMNGENDAGRPASDQRQSCRFHLDLQLAGTSQQRSNTSRDMDPDSLARDFITYPALAAHQPASAQPMYHTKRRQKISAFCPVPTEASSPTWSNAKHKRPTSNSVHSRPRLPLIFRRFLDSRSKTFFSATQLRWPIAPDIFCIIFASNSA